MEYNLNCTLELKLPNHENSVYILTSNWPDRRASQMDDKTWIAAS